MQWRRRRQVCLDIGVDELVAVGGADIAEHGADRDRRVVGRRRLIDVVIGRSDY